MFKFTILCWAFIFFLFSVMKHFNNVSLQYCGAFFGPFYKLAVEVKKMARNLIVQWISCDVTQPFWARIFFLQHRYIDMLLFAHSQQDEKYCFTNLELVAMVVLWQNL